MSPSTETGGVPRLSPLWSWLLFLPLLVYGLTLAATWPSAALVVDEQSYLTAAAAFAEGDKTLHRWALAPLREVTEPASRYVPGLSALMTPVVALFGWRGAFAVPLLGLLLGVLATTRLLRAQRLPPEAVALVWLYVPTFALSRLAMSDMPSLAVVAGSLALFWREDGPRVQGRRLLAGVLAGVSLSLRETNPLVLAPFFAQALWRRERGVPALVVGGLLGLAVRPALSAWAFGDPWAVKPPGYGFAWATVTTGGPLYLLLSCVALPLGLPAALRYRGERAGALQVSVLALLGLYSCYTYTAAESGPAQRLLLVGRFVLPLVPVLTVAVAWSWADLLRRRTGDAAAEPVARAARLRQAALVVALVAGCVWAVGANLGLARRDRAAGAVGAQLADLIPEGAVVICQVGQDDKLLGVTRRHVRPAPLAALRPAHLAAVQARAATERRSVLVMLHERHESAHWRGVSARAAAQVTAAVGARAPALDAALPGPRRVRVWRLDPPAVSP